MKIKQNPESGQIEIELKNNEVYDIEEHLAALMEFVCKQAVDVFRLTNSYRKIVGRLDELDKNCELEKKYDSNTTRKP